MYDHTSHSEYGEAAHVDRFRGLQILASSFMYVDRTQH